MNKLDEMDRLRLELVTERVNRLAAEANALNLARQQLQQEQVAVEAQQKKLSDDLRERYDLKPADSVDVKTGAITRGPAVVPMKASSDS